jgi:flavodoxin I
MKALIVYDSFYGNTEGIAKSIGIAIGSDAKLLRIGQVIPAELESIDLLVVGSPTRWGKPSPAIQDFLKTVPETAIKGVKVAAFDTRLPTKLVGLSGYAAGKIADALKTKGGSLIAPPEGFFTTGKSLKEGEVERAAAWAKALIKSKAPA